MFKVTTLEFDLDLFSHEEYICMAQHNNESKLHHLPLLGGGGVFKIYTSLTIVVVVLVYNMTNLEVQVLYFIILKLN